MRKISVVLAVVVLGAGLGACGKHGAKNVYSCPNKGSGVGFEGVKKGKLTVQTSLPAKSFWTGADVDHLTGGYEFELAKDLCAQLGLGRVRVVDKPFASLASGETTDFDIALAELTTSGRGTHSTGYLATDQGIAVNTGTVVPNLAAAKKLTWGVESGTTSGAYLAEHVKPTSATKSFASAESLFAALKAKDVDAVLVPTRVALANVESGQQVVGQFATHEQFGALLPKGSPNTKLVNAAIAKLQANGTLAKLEKSFSGPATAVPYIAAG